MAEEGGPSLQNYAPVMGHTGPNEPLAEFVFKNFFFQFKQAAENLIFQYAYLHRGEDNVCTIVDLTPGSRSRHNTWDSFSSNSSQQTSNNNEQLSPRKGIEQNNPSSAPSKNLISLLRGQSNSTLFVPPPQLVQTFQTIAENPISSKYGDNKIFEQLILAFATIAKHSSSSIIEALHDWKIKQKYFPKEEIQQKIIEYVQNNVKKQQQQQKQAELISTYTDRKKVACDYIFCSVVLVILRNSSELDADISVQLEAMCFEQFKNAEIFMSNGQLLESKKKILDMYAEIIGILSMKRFTHITSTFNETISTTGPVKNNESVNYLRGTKYIHLQLRGAHAIKNSVNFLQKIYDAVSKTKKKEMRNALCEVGASLLTPLAECEYGDPNIFINWFRLLNQFFQLAIRYSKKPKYQLTAFPFMTAIICVLPNEQFMTQFPSHIDTLCKFLTHKEKNFRLMAMDCLIHILGYYLSLRSKSREVQKVLTKIVQNLFHFEKRKTNPHSTSLDQQYYALIDIIILISKHKLEFSLDKIVLELLKTDSITSTLSENTYLGLLAFTVLADQCDLMNLDKLTEEERKAVDNYPNWIVQMLDRLTFDPNSNLEDIDTLNLSTIRLNSPYSTFKRFQNKKKTGALGFHSLNNIRIVPNQNGSNSNLLRLLEQFSPVISTFFSKILRHCDTAFGSQLLLSNTKGTSTENKYGTGHYSVFSVILSCMNRILPCEFTPRQAMEFLCKFTVHTHKRIRKRAWETVLQVMEFQPFLGTAVVESFFSLLTEIEDTYFEFIGSNLDKGIELIKNLLKNLDPFFSVSTQRFGSPHLFGSYKPSSISSPFQAGNQKVSNSSEPSSSQGNNDDENDDNDDNSNLNELDSFETTPVLDVSLMDAICISFLTMMNKDIRKTALTTFDLVRKTSRLIVQRNGVSSASRERVSTMMGEQNNSKIPLGDENSSKDATVTVQDIFEQYGDQLITGGAEGLYETLGEYKEKKMNLQDFLENNNNISMFLNNLGKQLSKSCPETARWVIQIISKKIAKLQASEKFWMLNSIELDTWHHMVSLLCGISIKNPNVESKESAQQKQKSKDINTFGGLLDFILPNLKSNYDKLLNYTVSALGGLNEDSIDTLFEKLSSIESEYNATSKVKRERKKKDSLRTTISMIYSNLSCRISPATLEKESVKHKFLDFISDAKNFLTSRDGANLFSPDLSIFRDNFFIVVKNITSMLNNESSAKNLNGFQAPTGIDYPTTYEFFEFLVPFTGFTDSNVQKRKIAHFEQTGADAKRLQEEARTISRSNMLLSCQIIPELMKGPFFDKNMAILKTWSSERRKNARAHIHTAELEESKRPRMVGAFSDEKRVSKFSKIMELQKKINYSVFGASMMSEGMIQFPGAMHPNQVSMMTSVSVTNSNSSSPVSQNLALTSGPSSAVNSAASASSSVSVLSILVDQQEFEKCKQSIHVLKWIDEVFKSYSPELFPIAVESLESIIKFNKDLLYLFVDQCYHATKEIAFGYFSAIFGARENIEMFSDNFPMILTLSMFMLSASRNETRNEALKLIHLIYEKTFNQQMDLANIPFSYSPSEIHLYLSIQKSICEVLARDFSSIAYDILIELFARLPFLIEFDQKILCRCLIPWISHLRPKFVPLDRFPNELSRDRKRDDAIFNTLFGLTQSYGTIFYAEIRDIWIEFSKRTENISNIILYLCDRSHYMDYENEVEITQFFNVCKKILLYGTANGPIHTRFLIDTLVKDLKHSRTEVGKHHFREETMLHEGSSRDLNKRESMKNEAFSNQNTDNNSTPLHPSLSNPGSSNNLMNNVENTSLNSSSVVHFVSNTDENAPSGANNGQTAEQFLQQTQNPASPTNSRISKSDLMLVFLSEIVFEHAEEARCHLPILLQYLFIRIDHPNEFIAEHAKKLLLHLIHTLVVNKLPHNTIDQKVNNQLNAAALVVENIQQQVLDTFLPEEKISEQFSWKKKPLSLGEVHQVSHPVIEFNIDTISMIHVKQCPRIAPIRESVNNILEIFGSEENLREDWARESLVWATKNHSLHNCIRSYQIYRILKPNFSKEDLDSIFADLKLFLEEIVDLNNASANVTSKIASNTSISAQITSNPDIQSNQPQQKQGKLDFASNSNLVNSQLESTHSSISKRIAIIVEIIDTLTDIVSSKSEDRILLFPQLLWLCVPLLKSDILIIYVHALGLFNALIDTFDFEDPNTINILIASIPTNGEFKNFAGFQPLILKGILNSYTEPLCIHILWKSLEKPFDSLFNTKNHVLISLIGLLPWLCHFIDDPNVKPICNQAALSFGKHFEEKKLKKIAKVFFRYSNGIYGSSEKFLFDMRKPFYETFVTQYEDETFSIFTQFLEHGVEMYKDSLLMILHSLMLFVDFSTIFTPKSRSLLFRGQRNSNLIPNSNSNPISTSTPQDFSNPTAAVTPLIETLGQMQQNEHANEENTQISNNLFNFDNNNIIRVGFHARKPSNSLRIVSYREKLMQLLSTFISTPLWNKATRVIDVAVRSSCAGKNIKLIYTGMSSNPSQNLNPINGDSLSLSDYAAIQQQLLLDQQVEQEQLSILKNKEFFFSEMNGDENNTSPDAAIDENNESGVKRRNIGSPKDEETLFWLEFAQENVIFRPSYPLLPKSLMNEPPNVVSNRLFGFYPGSETVEMIEYIKNIQDFYKDLGFCQEEEKILKTILRLDATTSNPSPRLNGAPPGFYEFEKEKSSSDNDGLGQIDIPDNYFGDDMNELNDVNFKDIEDQFEGYESDITEEYTETDTSAVTTMSYFSTMTTQYGNNMMMNLGEQNSDDQNLEQIRKWEPFLADFEAKIDSLIGFADSSVTEMKVSQDFWE